MVWIGKNLRDHSSHMLLVHGDDIGEIKRRVSRSLHFQSFQEQRAV